MDTVTEELSKRKARGRRGEIFGMGARKSFVYSTKPPREIADDERRLPNFAPFSLYKLFHTDAEGGWSTVKLW